MSDLTTKAAEIRAGLVADWRKAMEGVPKGPWHSQPGTQNPYERDVVQGDGDGDPWSIAIALDGAERRTGEDIGNWIARCSPAGIAPLLALIEQRAAELAEARASWNRLDDKANEWADRAHQAETRATTAESERDELLREKERLGKLSDRYGVALMMIRAGCSQPQRFAGNILDDKEPVEIDLEDCDEDHR